MLWPKKFLCVVKNVKIIPSCSKMQIMTNAVTGEFYSGADNIILGKRTNHEDTVKVSGTSNLGIFEYTFKIPARLNEANLTNSTERIVKSPTEVKKDQFLERLWYFFKIKKILFNENRSHWNRIEVVNNRQSHEDTVQDAEAWARKFGFVTNTTAYILREDEITPEHTGGDEEIETSYSIIEKSLHTGAIECEGSLHFFAKTYLRGPKVILRGSRDQTNFSYETATSLLVSGQLK